MRKRRGITQLEARNYKRCVAILEDRLRRMRYKVHPEHFNSVEIAFTQFDDVKAFLPNSIRVAQRLGHAVVCTVDDTGRVRYLALPLPEMPV